MTRIMDRETFTEEECPCRRLPSVPWLAARRSSAGSIDFVVSGIARTCSSRSPAASFSSTVGHVCRQPGPRSSATSRTWRRGCRNLGTRGGQHGRALRGLLEAVWPTFDWEGAYAASSRNTSFCAGSRLRQPRAGDGRTCIGETGTSTIYRALRDLADEPILARLCEHIRSDEVPSLQVFSCSTSIASDAHEKNSRYRIGVETEEPPRRGATGRRVGLWACVRHRLSGRTAHRQALRRDAEPRRAMVRTPLPGRRKR